MSEHGVNLCNAIDFMNRNNVTVTVDKYTIMPNHAHIIVFVSGASGKPRPTNAIIPKFISSIKRYTNKLAGFDMWQTSYHDHIIRNDTEYLRIWQYIDNNPANWDDDCYHN
jgi:REP element-mobilizing transposase RayT